MKCPFCRQVENDIVLDSRVTREGSAIRRRRECGTCQKRWTTYEQTEALKSVSADRAKRIAARLRGLAGRLAGD